MECVLKELNLKDKKKIKEELDITLATLGALNQTLFLRKISTDLYNEQKKELIAKIDFLIDKL